MAKMTVEEIYIKIKDELSVDNDVSSSPERIFIKNDEQTICTLGMNRSHEIIFVEFKPTPKDLTEIEKEGFVHPHPVEMLHDAGWRQAQITVWEEAQKLLEIINRSYKKKKKPVVEDSASSRRAKIAMMRSRAAAKLAARHPVKLVSLMPPTKPGLKKAEPAKKVVAKAPVPPPPKAKAKPAPKAKPAKKVIKAKPAKKAAKKPKK
ncbi:MAG TPA: hypothetical protein VFG11_07105 [Acidobacteriota bacterium]|nr:hypothetical protein [Acidobacteriota bacterium]